MNTAGRNEDWTGPQLAATLATLDGAAPEPVAYLVCRHTITPGGKDTLVFQAEDAPAPFPQQELPAWLARRHLRGADRLALALLVIHETVDAEGLIRDCILERRRGAVDGPLVGEPARVTFTGPARTVRSYRAQPDGRLIEMAPPVDAPPLREHPPDQWANELTVLRARFGNRLRVLDVREPTPLEVMVGCDRIMHVRLPNGREIGCGIGWFGPVPFVLAAAFPRAAIAPVLPTRDEAAVQVFLQREALVRHETRSYPTGFAVVARRRGTQQLALLHVTAGVVRAEPYDPAPFAGATTDQLSWMRYAETYENLAILDAWPDGDTEALLVVTGEASGQIWRHQVDRDGVEVWRKPDEEAASGILYRERLALSAPAGTVLPHAVAELIAPVPAAVGADGAAKAVGTDAAAVASDVEPPPTGGWMEVADASLVPELPLPAQPQTPRDSLLAKAEAYVTAIAALHDAQEAAGSGRAADVPDHLRVLLAALDALPADSAAAETSLLLCRVEAGLVPAADLGGALGLLAARLPQEVADKRLLILGPVQWRRMVETAPFGRAVEDAFPEAAYDCEEAALCLAFGRPTASAFHCMRAVTAGLAALGPALAAVLPGEGRAWPQVLAAVRAAAGVRHAALVQTLDSVRRCCRDPRLGPAAKYTEAEAERLFQAVGAFMAAAASVVGGSPLA